VPPGSTFTVDIVISGVSAAAPLNAFEFDLFFDPAVLTAVSVVDGGFLLSPVFTIQEIIGGLSVEFAEVTLGPFGASGSGALATITFDATGKGESVLDLDNVILSAPFGVEIVPTAIEDGFVNTIPEPNAALLFATGFAASGMALRRARGRLL
jgi:hypothetical protein